MPRLLFRNGRLVFRNGRAQPDDAACRERCCDGGPPGPCCPSICGETFRTCVKTLNLSYTQSTDTELEAGPPTTRLRGPVAEVCSATLNATPINGQPANGCTAVATLPLARVYSIDYPEGRVGNFEPPITFPDDTYIPSLTCDPLVTTCVRESSGTESTAPPPLGDYVFQLNSCGGHYFANGTGPLGFADDWASNRPSGTYTTTALWGPGGFEVSATFSATVSHSWSMTVQPDGSYKLLIRTRVNGTVVPATPFLDGAGPNAFRRIYGETWQSDFEAEIAFIPITKCDGTPGPATACDEPDHDCTETRFYLRAEPCIGQTPAPPPVVFLARNVTACRVIAVGTACYKISPRSPRTNDPGAAYIDFRIIDANAGSSTCCACMADCDSQAMPSYPCWVNALRNAQGQLVTSPATIGDEPCCCFDDDIITIAQINGEITFPGFPEQRWRLRRPIVFRRGDALFSQEVVSSVTYPDGTPVYPNGYNHGTFHNDPTAECAWRSSLGGFFVPFADPQNGASAQPVGFNLPCPITNGDGVLNGWSIRQYSISATCDQFVYDAVYDGPGGAVFHANTRVLVQQAAEAENRRCGGKCLPPRVIKPGGGDGDIRLLIG